MMCLKPLPRAISAALLLFGMGMAGASQAAGVPNGAPLQGKAAALQANVANSTNRIIVKYRQALEFLTRNMTWKRKHRRDTGEYR